MISDSCCNIDDVEREPSTVLAYPISVLIIISLRLYSDDVDALKHHRSPCVMNMFRPECLAVLKTRGVGRDIDQLGVRRSANLGGIWRCSMFS